MTNVGATPFVLFKANSAGTSDSKLWNKLWHSFHLNREEFLPHYHRRSNIETTFSMIKRVIGEPPCWRGCRAWRRVSTID